MSRIKVTLPELRRMIAEGLSTKQIAAHFDVPSPAITRTCHANDIPLPHGGRKRGGWASPDPTRADDERDLKILRLVMRGDGHNNVAARLGISNMTVQRLVQQIEAADIAESGEPVMQVARHYANPRRRRA